MTPDTARPLSLVFIGCGNAARMHSRTLASVAPDVRRFYASRDPDRARDFNRRLGGAGVFASYAEALHAPGIDAAIVVTPPSSHLDLSLEALGAGKHVIVEKPAYLRAGDVATVLRAAERAGRQVMVAENYFYKPLLRRLRAILASGDLGEIRFLHLNALKTQAAPDWRADAAVAGGGALFEGGIHWINLMASLGPEVRRVRGFRPGRNAAAGPERSMLVVFEYEDGAVGTLSYSWEVHSPLKGVRLSRIYGTAGTVAFESNGIFAVQTGRRKRLHLPGLRDIAGYRGMFRDLVDALREGRPPAFETRLAARDLRLVEQAYRTAGLDAAAPPGADASGPEDDADWREESA